MHHSIAILLAVIALVFAAPTPTLLPRECSTATPYFLQQLDSSSPEMSFINQVNPLVYGDNSPFWITRDTRNMTSPKRTVQFVDFAIPEGSHTCTLHFSDERSTIQYTKNDLPSLFTPTLNVISLIPNALRANPTYGGIFNSNPPIISSGSFSTISLQKGSGSRVLNSRACPPLADNGGVGRLQFVFEFLDGMNGGYEAAGGAKDSVYFDQGLPAIPRFGGINGVYMTYNC